MWKKEKEKEYTEIEDSGGGGVGVKRPTESVKRINTSKEWFGWNLDTPTQYHLKW